MIGSVASTTSFGAVVDYLLHGKPKVAPSERVDWITTRNLPGNDPVANGVVMQATADQNPRVAEPAYHLKISWHPEDHPTRHEMELVANRVLEDLGLKGHQVLIVGHKDRPHRHMHLLVNRVHPATYRAWKRYQDWPKIERSLRQLEQELKFRLTPGNLHRLPEVKAPNRELARTSAEVQRYRRTGQRPFVDSLRDEGIAEIMKAAGSWQQLEEHLAERGLYLRRSGRGLHVTDGDGVAKASALDRGSSLARLESRFAQPFSDHRSRHPDPPPLSPRPSAPTPQQNLAAARRLLPEDGSLPELENRLARLLAEPPPDLRRIYRHPAQAEAELQRSLGQAGPIDTFRSLRDQPQSFGELRGRRLLRRANASRAEALREARSLGQSRLDQHVEVLRTRDAIRNTRRYQKRSQKLRSPTPVQEPRQSLESQAQRFLEALPETTKQQLLESRLPPSKERANFLLPRNAPADAARILRTAARVLTDPAGALKRQALKPVRQALARSTTVRGSTALAKHANLMLRLLREAPFIVANPAAASVLLSVELASKVLRLPARLLEQADRPSQRL
jgi:MobA/VirD2-like, nuclease domain/TraI-like middle domain